MSEMKGRDDVRDRSDTSGQEATHTQSSQRGQPSPTGHFSVTRHDDLWAPQRTINTPVKDNLSKTDAKKKKKLALVSH